MGGCVALPRYLGADGPDAFATRAIEEAGVLTLPSSIYSDELGDVPTDRIRIGFGRTRQTRDDRRASSAPHNSLRMIAVIGPGGCATQ